MWGRANKQRDRLLKKKQSALSKKKGGPKYDKRYREPRERSSLSSDSNRSATSLLKYAWTAAKHPSIREKFPKAFKGESLKTPSQSFVRIMNGNYEIIRRKHSENTSRQNLVGLILRLSFFLKNIGIYSQPLLTRKCKRSEGFTIVNPERRARLLSRQLKIHLQTFTPSNWNRYFDSHLRITPIRRRMETEDSLSESFSELSSESSFDEVPESMILRSASNLACPPWLKNLQRR